MNLSELDAHLAAAMRFVNDGNKLRALEELRDARVMVREGDGERAPMIGVEWGAGERASA